MAHNNTSHEPIPSGGAVLNQDEDLAAACVRSGGIWNPDTQTCIREEEPQPEVPAEPQTGDARGQSVLRDSQTGRLSGVNIGDRTFLGLSPEEVRGITEREAQSRELVVGGAAEAAQAGSRERLAREGLDLSAQVGGDPVQNVQSQFSAQEVDYVAALASGVPGILPDLITGATTGATGAFVLGQLGPQAATPEEVITVPTAAIITGVANAVRGFYSEFVSDITKQKGEIIETPIRTLTETKSIMNDIISAQNANPAESSSNLEAFNGQLQLLDDEFDRLKDLTDDNLNQFLGVNGINQLQEFEVYYVQDGERDRQIREMQLALANPNPSIVRVGGDTLDKLKKRIDDELKRLQ